MFLLPILARAETCDPKTSTRLCNPLGETDIAKIIGFFLKTLVPLAGVIALLIFIIASIRFILSSGNAEKVQEGKDTAVWALLGTIVILGSYIALNFIFKVLTGPATPGY
jgi:hypothetical protein